MGKVLTEFVTPICIAGPTGCGKTAAALALAERLPVEIVSVDSALVYRHMDIGTAKPTAAEMAVAPHHLIDIIEPTESYSAAEFVRAARQLAGEIQSRGRLPLFVGGTMLYFKGLFDGLSAMPQADAALRRQLDERAAVEGWPAMHAQLAQLDPAIAARLAPNDSQRIQRALEVCMLAGKPMSELHEVREPGVDWPIFSLEPNDRAWLHARLALRFELMLKAGLVDEVKRLRERGDLTPELPSMRCVGYRQTWEALDSGDFSTLSEKGIAATRQLAKRQITWLRAMPQRRVIASDGEQPVPELLAAVQRLLTS